MGTSGARRGQVLRSLFISGFASQALSRQAMDGRLGEKHSHLADKRSPRTHGWLAVKSER